MSRFKYPYKYYFIYKIVNLINQKSYVGFHATNKEFDEDDYFGGGTLFNKKILEYGIENFIMGIIEYIDPNEWQEKEKYWIKEMKSHIRYGKGYNLTDGGEGGYGKIWTKESKEKLSKAQIQIWTKEKRKEHGLLLKKSYENNINGRKKLSISAKHSWKNVNYRNNLIEKIKHKYDNPDYLNNRIENTKKLWKNKREELIVSMKKTWANEELRKKMGKGGILKIKNGIIIKEYCSTRVAAEQENINCHQTIMNYCNRNKEDKNGYRWYYKRDFLKEKSIEN